MPAPVINPSTSVLGFFANSFAAFQAATMDGQTGTWTCPNLPPGLAITPATGLISGVPTSPGIYDCVLSVTNVSGTGILPVTFGIEDGGYVSDIGIEVNIDLITGAVTFPTSADGKLHAKLGDYLPLLIATQKNGVSLDLPVVAIAVGVKEFESESLLELSTGAFTKVGAYENTRWRTLFYLDPTKLSSALDDYEGAAAVGGGKPDANTDESQLVTLLAMPCEIRVKIQQQDANLTPPAIDRSSQIFPLILERNLAPAP